MSNLKRIVWLLSALAAIAFLPYLSALIQHGGSFPPNYFEYPPLTVPSKAPFNSWIFGVVAIFCAAVATFLLFPNWFGFKKMDSEPPLRPAPKVKLPVWFWIGFVMWATTLVVLWAKISEPKMLLNWADLPLFWGFTLMIDGWVYVRTGGRSIISVVPQELIAMGVASIGGWMLFEYLNFFVDDNWLYPFGYLIPKGEFLIYAILGSSGLMPPIYELYCLFCTFPKLKNRYSNGPKLGFPNWLTTLVLLGGLAGLGLVGFYPQELFGILWMAPLLILTVVIHRCGLWTPFDDLKRGNWTALILYGLTYVLFGFLLESWNYFSAPHAAAAASVASFNPAFWAYSLPYVSVLHVFEMPLLGYAGYFPFGVYCPVWWMFFSFLLSIPSRFVKGGIPDL